MFGFQVYIEPILSLKLLRMAWLSVATTCINSNLHSLIQKLFFGETVAAAHL